MVEPIKIQITLSDLMDVINSSSNPQVALEILEGSYVNALTHIDEQSRYHEDHSIKNDNATHTYYKLIFVSYNKWTNEVTFIKDNAHWAWKRNNTMALSAWRDTLNFEPYALEA